MARRSTVRGAASFRRLLKRLPDSATEQLKTFLNAAGPILAEQMKSGLPVLTSPRPDRTPGALRASISYKVTPSTLNLKVGTLSAKLGRSSLFYGHILDTGRKAKNVKVTRGSRKYPKGINVKALQPLYVVSRVRATFLKGSLPGYRTIMDSILADAARGAGDD